MSSQINNLVVKNQSFMQMESCQRLEMKMRRRKADNEVYVKIKGGEVKQWSSVKTAQTALLRLELTVHQSVQLVLRLAGFRMLSTWVSTRILTSSSPDLINTGKEYKSYSEEKGDDLQGVLNK